MGELSDIYQRHLSMRIDKTQAEHTYAITVPPIHKSLKPRVIAAAPMKIDYVNHPTDGTIMATIRAETIFQDALGLFAEVSKTTHQSTQIMLTECSFLNEKLVKLGMELIEEGFRDMPSVFSVTPERFYELAGQGFYLKGIYHGKPFKIWPAESDGRFQEHRLRLLRRREDREYTDSYTLENIVVAKPEEVEEHVTKFEEALEAWDEAVHRKHALKHGAGGLLE